MVRKLKFNNPSLLERVKIVNALQSVYLSDMESAVLAELISCSSSGCLTLTVDLTKQIKSIIDASSASFNVALHRLTEKKAIKKEGKTIVLPPIYNNLQSLTGLLIEFNPPSAENI